MWPLTVKTGAQATRSGRGTAARDSLATSEASPERKDWRQMRIVVTGGAGFLGSYVAGFVANAGHDVAVLDRVPPRFNEVPHLPADLLSLDSVESALDGADAVFHLGAVGDVY